MQYICRDVAYVLDFQIAGTWGDIFTVDQLDSCMKYHPDPC